MEEWRDIKGFKGWQISDKGRMRRLIMNTWTPIELYFNESVGHYMHTMRGDDGKVHTKYPHRLVAETFIDNPDGYKAVKHKDGDKRNNNVDNLYWCEQVRHRKEKDAKKHVVTPRFIYFVKQKLINGCVIGVFKNFALLEAQGFKKSSIMLASSGRYKNGNKGFTDVYKNFKWEVERISIRELKKKDRYVG